VLQVIRRALQVRCPDGPEVRQAMGALLLREKGSRGTGKTWGMRGESLVSAYQARSAGNSPTRLIPDPVREGPLPDSHRLTFVMRNCVAIEDSDVGVESARAAWSALAAPPRNTCWRSRRCAHNMAAASSRAGRICRQAQLRPAIVVASTLGFGRPPNENPMQHFRITARHFEAVCHAKFSRSDGPT
jgi:hypothetical protein